jgi:tripartite-type tricarboxylate transporter receptor subunit TctC
MGWQAITVFNRAIAAALLGCVPLAALAQATATGSGQAYPAKPVRLIVGFAAGGPNDIVARGLAQKLSEQTGQQFIVENRAGANTAVATEFVARAPPDGYLVMFVSPGHATNPSLMKLNFDSMRDFAFVTQVADAQNLVVVHPSLPVRSIRELIAFAKARPGEINYGSSGAGSTGHLSTELFQLMTGTKMVHIPYKGAGPALIELLAGQHVLYFGNIAGIIGYVRSNRMRALAVTGEKRSPSVPDVPTVIEAGLPGFVVTAFYGIALPAKAPRAIVEKLNGEVVRALKTPDFNTRLRDHGTEPVGSTPEQYTAFMQNEIAKWAKVIKAAGIKGE